MYFNKYRKDSKKKISNKKPKNHLNILFKQSQKKIIPHPISQIEKNNKEYNKDFNNLNKNTKPNSKNCEEKNINDNDLLLKYTLKILDLEKLFNNFNLNYISFYDLFLLTKDDLIEMNIPIGPRNRILHFSLEFKKFSKNFDLNELIKFFNIHKEFIFNETIFDENKNINKIKNEMGNIYFNNPIYNSSQISKNSFQNYNIINLRRTISINNNNSSNNNENLVNKVKKFENQNLKKKEKSNALNNKIKNLLNKKQFDFKNFKNQLFDNNYLFEEKERNLNEELNKIYYQKY